MASGVKGFQKGKSGNPNGRPRGTLNHSTKMAKEFAVLAQENYNEAFTILWERIKQGEAWAIQFFLKEIAPYHKHWVNSKINLDSETRINNTTDISLSIAKLTEKLLNVDALSVEESMNLLKVMNGIKIADNMQVIRQTQLQLSDAQIEYLYNLTSQESS